MVFCLKRLFSLIPCPVNPQTIQQAAALLRDGKLVAIPTETVYGLGADAANPEAVVKIFQAKGRPADHPLIVHLALDRQIRDWASDIPDSAWRLASAFWPGPLTLILPKQAWVSKAVTGGQDTVGLRVPAHPVASWLLRTFGGGIAAPSANRFGRISPTLAAHVAEELGDSIDCILDGGPCLVGVESTIVDLTDRQPTILRPGRISHSQLESVLECDVALQSQHKIRAPGMLAAHYAPTTPALLCRREQLIDQFDSRCAQGQRVGVLSFGEVLTDFPCQWQQHLSATPGAYEAALYQALRQLDQAQLDCILVQAPPQEEAWAAVNDRLGKATVNEL